MKSSDYKLQVASVSNGDFADIRPRQWKTIFRATSTSEILDWLIGDLNKSDRKRSFDPATQWIRLMQNKREIASS